MIKMYKGYRILAIVTARGGSKGLPGKNVKDLNGKPLIAWTIRQIQERVYTDDIFISTDSREIAEISALYGVEVPCLRPDYLAADTASSMDVMEYTINLLEKQNKQYDYVILLEPTSPLRKRGDIDGIIRLAADNPESDGVISVGRVHLEHPMIVKKVSDRGNIIPYTNMIPKVYQRQQHDEALFPYGVGYLIKVDVFKEKHTIYTENVLPYYIERWQNYEIDDIYDFCCIETIMRMEMKKI